MLGDEFNDNREEDDSDEDSKDDSEEDKNICEKIYTVYNFEFEKDGKPYKVEFLDTLDTHYSIDENESLKQVSSLHRRKWATHSINLMKAAGKQLWGNFPIQDDLDCPFGRRLSYHQWNNPTVFLIDYEGCPTTGLYIYRLYILFYFTNRTSFYMPIVTASNLCMRNQIGCINS